MRVLSVIGAPSSAGAYAPGQELAPKALREAGLLDALRDSGIEAGDRGDLETFRWAPDREQPRAQNAGSVAEIIASVEREVRAALAQGADRALVLGGDCTVGLGAIQALSGSDGTHGVVYLDLHADLNVPASTPDGALDWMGLAHALALEGAVPGVSERCRLAPDQVVLLGFDRGQATAWEREQVDELGLAVVPTSALSADAHDAASRALGSLGAVDRIAVHFDVDVIDFVDAPLSENTGRNVGVTLETAVAALGVLLRDPRVRTIAITELNPLHGAQGGATLRRLIRALAGVWTR